ncbi:hypothetical protein WJX81_004092 [Elliptochloris bilobata]|uniref:Beta-galactosidase n=1 Tax=Elliptochloris bilobata TaxID=381761 RepID=A0AAW1QK25_9CHLO
MASNAMLACAVLGVIFCTFILSAYCHPTPDVHVVFSSHLDIGFKDAGSVESVVNEYFNQHFPDAIATASQVRSQQGRQYRYMTHSWLVSLYLDCPPGLGLDCPSATAVTAFKAAVHRGDIYWHALPFNLEAEVADTSLLAAAVNITHDLDARFGLPPKMTVSQRDVPGLTRSAIPVLRSAGVRAISIGVNQASAPPGVPKNTPFIWRDERTSTSLIGMLHPGGYSGLPVDDGTHECVLAPGFYHVLCCAWNAGDNSGPHTASQVADIFDILSKDFPNSVIRASTFDEYVAELLDYLPTYRNWPTVTQEIGDTWVYGVASDPQKLARFRALMRMRSALPEEALRVPALKNFTRMLLKIPEHTWGADMKTYLPDFDNWDNADFHAHLGDWDYQAVVAGWYDQAAYLDHAVEALSGSPEGQKARDALTQLDALWQPPSTAGFQALGMHDTLTFASHAWTISLDPATGALAGLQRRWRSSPGRTGAQWVGSAKPFGVFTYSTYTEDDYSVIWDNYAYISPDTWWFKQDFGKSNCSSAHPRRADTVPQARQVWLQQVSPGSFRVLVRASMPLELTESAGGPAEVWLDIASLAGDDRLLYDVLWVNKTATRLPEAVWLAFQPSLAAADASSWLMQKLGQPVSPLDVIRNGSQAMHAVDDDGVAVVGTGPHAWERLQIRSLDAALVSPGKRTPFPNLDPAAVDMSQGVSFCLSNNIWGTNYVMWTPYGKQSPTMRFRFEILARDVSPPSSTSGFAAPPGTACDRLCCPPGVLALLAALLATGAAAAPSAPAWSSFKQGATTGWLTMDDAPHFVGPQSRALAAGTNRSFIVAGQGDVFLKDGQPFRFIAGTIHYFRIHPAYWEDRLMRLKALGLTAVQVYVPWNHHELYPFQYTWDGAADVVQFLETADKLGLLVILRPGPYICAEWDFGGFPWWLGSSQVVGGGQDKATQMRIRSDDPKYLQHVDRWWNTLLPRLAHLTYQRGGPIIATQVENEFGFIGPNEPYLRHLIAIAKAAFGPDHILFTTDPPVHVTKGSLRGGDVLSVVDFGAHWFSMDDAFGRQKSMNPPGQSPVWCSEFYTGWLTWWGQAMANSSIYDFLDTFDQILRYNNNMGSVTLYMASGGTNFGYTAGSQVDGTNDPTWDWEAGELQAKGKYSSVITSYDYASPVSEAGDYGQPGINGPNKFELIRASIANHTGNAVLPMPPRPTIHAYGSVALTQQASLLSQLPQLVPGDGILSDLPLPMEEYGQQGGLILYRIEVNSSQIFNNATLYFGDRVHDSAIIMVNGIVIGRLDRNQEANLELGINAPSAGPVVPSNSSAAILDILVEGYARRNTGTEFDFKGLPSSIVLLNGLPLTGWRVFTLPISDTSVLCFPKAAAAPAPAPALAPAKLAAAPHPNVATNGPIFFKGTLYVDPSLADNLGRFPDSYLSVANGWNKGLVFINGYNIGPYWPAFGPQETQYVPGPLLKACDNEIILLETGGGMGSNAVVTFTTAANFYGPATQSFGGAATEGGAAISAAPSPGSPAVGKQFGGHMVMPKTEL